MKICTKCFIEKLINEFHKDAQKKNGLSSKCKSCAHLDRIKRYANTREQSIKYSKKWSKENSEKSKEFKKNWIIKNPLANKIRKAKEYKENRIKILGQNSLWQKNNRSICSARLAKYRACKKNATPSWANFDKIKELYAACKVFTFFSGIKHEVDHIIPLQNDLVCGLHWENNLQILASKDNKSKGNKILERMIWQ